jgi:hypothetical protein
MSLASWFRVSKSLFTSALKRPPSRQIVRRQPLRPRLFLESLEARVMLDASSGVLGGGLNNLSFNTSSASTGVELPVFTSGPHATGLAGLSAGGAASLGTAGSYLTQDQPNSQFRIFGINSEGDDNRLGLRSMMSVLFDAYGFGSGVQPNAPWKPAAYNLGLANHQFDYPTELDNGYGGVPPWHHPVAADQTDAAVDEKTPESDDANAPLISPSARPDEPPERGDPTLEEKLFGDPLTTLATAAETQRVYCHENNTSEDGSIPNVLWLAALPPSHLAVLAAGLTTLTAPVEEGESDSSAGTPE